MGTFVRMISGTSILTIPSEILLKIFENLQHDDLGNVMLVCKRWSEVGEDPVLWKNFKLVVNDENIDKFIEILETKRLKNVRKVIFENCLLKNCHMLAVRRSNISQIVMSRSDTFDFDCDITKVSANLFAETVNNLGTFEFYNWDIKLTQSQQ